MSGKNNKPQYQVDRKTFGEERGIKRPTSPGKPVPKKLPRKEDK